jgi:hypothetical protein
MEYGILNLNSLKNAKTYYALQLYIAIHVHKCQLHLARVVHGAAICFAERLWIRCGRGEKNAVEGWRCTGLSAPSPIAGRLGPLVPERFFFSLSLFLRGEINYYQSEVQVYKFVIRGIKAKNFRVMREGQSTKNPAPGIHKKT